MKIRLKNLQSIGGKHWVRKDMDRVYLPIGGALLDALSGSRCPISREINEILKMQMNSQETALLYSALSSAKFWYDLRRKDFHIKIHYNFRQYEEIEFLLESLSIKLIVFRLKTGARLPEVLPLSM